MPSRPVIAPLLALCLAAGASGFSVLTHEAIIDSAWKDNIVPLLMKRYPDSTEEDLRKAHAYSYGGAIIQDMGYYPFGSAFLSDLAHYVRSGDLILNLLSEAANLNEYAFALGSLAHYASDNYGHRDAVNKSVPIIYPKLKKRFGGVVTYADDKTSHMKIEFAFDVAQVAHGNYAAEAYHNFIGFEVAQAVLERAFVKTYGIELSSIIHEDVAIGTYRFTVHSIFPLITRAAWDMQKQKLGSAPPTITKKRFMYNLSRASYQKEWGKNYERPGFRARLIAWVFRVIPKIGPFKAFAFKPPTPATETMFMKSVNETLTQYRTLLAAQGRGALKLPNLNFDTGEPVKPGSYRLADAAYAKLLDKLNGKPVPPDLRDNILAYYSDMSAPFATKKDPKAWEKVLRDLDALKAQEPAAVSQSAGR
jgi:Zinc dependent phospholipase C